MHAIAHSVFRVASWAAPRIAFESMAQPSFFIGATADDKSAVVFCCAVFTTLSVKKWPSGAQLDKVLDTVMARSGSRHTSSRMVRPGRCSNTSPGSKWPLRAFGKNDSQARISLSPFVLREPEKPWPPSILTIAIAARPPPPCRGRPSASGRFQTGHRACPLVPSTCAPGFPRWLCRRR